MRRTTVWVCAIVLGLVLTGSARADLLIKWSQAPDETTNGIDVMATSPALLADDFLCMDSSPITAVHLWGSWLDGLKTDQVQFRLSIWTDIPSSEAPYSMPSLEVWNHVFNPGEYQTLLWGTSSKDWYNPVTGVYENNDHTQTWQYNFLFPDDPFLQEGTSDAPIVYWLAVEATVLDGSGAKFGWTTSIMHWNDDAVYWSPYIDSEGSGWFWKDLVYPDGHPYETLNPYTGTNSMDMAFALMMPEPATLALVAGGVGTVLLRRWRRR